MAIKNSHYIMSDPHIGHKGIIPYSRPQFDTLEEMNELILDNIRQLKPTDWLILLGDIAWNLAALELFASIECNLRLVGGNHDNYHVLKYLKYFKKYNGCISTGLGPNNEYRCILTHIPVHPIELQRWHFNIHGHKHDHIMKDPEGYEDKRYINVCCEQLDYKPIKLGDLIDQQLQKF